MSLIFGRQNQTERIGSTTLVTKPEFSYCFLNKVLAKNTNRQWRSLDHVYTRTSSLRQSISAHTQMKLCRWGEGKHAVCASRREGCLPPRSRRSRASTRCLRRRLSSSSANSSSSGVCLCVWRMVQSRMRREWQSSRSRHHHHPIPSARGKA